MKSICLVICLLFFAGCTATTDPGLPSGYKLLCSHEGKYALIIPDVTGGKISATIWETAIDAKEFAWFYEEWRKKPHVKYEWHECE